LKRALFIGRWQPFHNGHKWLIDQKLSEGKPVLIAVRDVPPDQKNPFTTDQTINMIQQVFKSEDDDVRVMRIPDIESVNYGRGVGYEINEHVPPKDIGFISATNIRSQIIEGNNMWKNNVHSSIQGLVRAHLLEGL